MTGPVAWGFATLCGSRSWYVLQDLRQNDTPWP